LMYLHKKQSSFKRLLIESSRTEYHFLMIYIESNIELL
jgi:hypothetical protein